MKPLAIDLYCGLGGWAEGFLTEGYDVIGFDIERRPYPAQLVLQDVLTLHGSQFRRAAVIVASPPCQAYSYRAMPWKKAKALPPPDNALFEACFRIAREAGLPIVVENVKGAQKWVGRARWHYGSYYLWGDVPALMPFTRQCAKVPGLANATFPAGGLAQGHIKNNGGSWFAVAHNTESGHSRNPDGRKFGGGWWHDSTNNLIRKASSGSSARKVASAQIAKIPFALAQHIARCFKL